MAIQDLHARAVRSSIDIVNQVQPEDFTRPTPCTTWTLADLIAHMIVQHQGFARAARGEITTASQWQPEPLEPDFASRHAVAAEEVIAAFAESGALEREVVLPEFGQPRQPARFAIAAHLIDYVVHGWDVARSIGVALPADGEVHAEALRIALGLTTKEPAFKPAVHVPASASDLDRTLGLLGRSPTWPS